MAILKHPCPGFADDLLRMLIFPLGSPRLLGSSLEEQILLAEWDTEPAIPMDDFGV